MDDEAAAVTHLHEGPGLPIRDPEAGIIESGRDRTRAAATDLIRQSVKAHQSTHNWQLSRRDLQNAANTWTVK